MTKYGYTTIGVVTIIVFVLCAVAILFNSNNILRIVLVISGLVLLAFTLNFFRDPDRNPPLKDNVVVSPADGKVVVIKEIYEDKYLKDKAWQVSIFMSPLNVHVNRFPVSGEVEYVKYIPGEYLIASNDKASEKNERAEFGISGKFGKVFFTQVAGFVARRIVYEVKLKDKARLGERFGMIKFGSRVDVIVPFSLKLKVKKDDKVKAGETILFEYCK
ncbi:MAG: phosphatidylserine decarboxylase family protein [Bacteroidota bacterium]|nr:phosphatidylserine decarboxylase family protein [Bacteroidota bacterium]MDP4192215.1 phosphatidylserine decarboxylase family protein [Bacteroidota bacterium]MDP4195481.1 phosphatidylserine decarboxylase family protein [Bacteroidota bacterium]